MSSQYSSSELNSNSKLINGMTSPTDPDRPIEIDGPDESLPGVLRSFFDGVVYSHGEESQPLIRRVKDATSAHAPRLKDASRNSVVDLIAWMKRGGALRHLFVISVGSIVMISLSGIFVFMAILAALTINSVVISILMSLAALGGFLAIFFALLTAIYIGTISVAIFVLSTVLISTIVAISIVSGWVGFFFMVWIVGKKILDLTKKSVNISCSAVSAYAQRSDS